MLLPMFIALLIRLAVTAAAFAVAAWLLDGMDVAGGFFAYVWIAILFGLVNAIVGTILRILTFPLTVLTLGLFSIIVNALLLELTDWLTSDLEIDSFFWTAIGAALIISITSVVIDVIIRLLVPKPVSD
jgi:putative membrane protein